jgi:hypothetical protein
VSDCPSSAVLRDDPAAIPTDHGVFMTLVARDKSSVEYSCVGADGKPGAFTKLPIA